MYLHNLLLSALTRTVELMSLHHAAADNQTILNNCLGGEVLIKYENNLWMENNGPHYLMSEPARELTLVFAR